MLAGSKDIKKCEIDPLFSYQINTKPVENISQIIIKHNLDTKLLFFSTDYVFNGKCGRYKSTSDTGPCTNYGKSNLLAEKLLTTSNINYKIIRTGAVMGQGSLFFDWLTTSLKNNRSVSLFDNSFYSPTPVFLLNEIIHNIILNYNTIPQKIIHLVGEQRLSRYEFGIIIQKLMNKHKLILSEHIDQPTFQKDLSLIQSDFVKQHQSKTLIEYLKLEISE